MDIMKAVLGFEDGDFVVGEGFGVKGECAGELVFNTQMTGYMESLTDPSYFGQILMFTFPQIGNYGVDPQNFQNPHVCALGCIAKEICEKPEHEPSIRTFFEENNLLGMTGVDTRALTIKARVHGTMRAALVVGSDNGAYAVALAKKTLASLRSPAVNHTISPVPENGSPSSISGLKRTCLQAFQNGTATCIFFRIMSHQTRLWPVSLMPSL